MANQTTALHHFNIRKRIYQKHETYPHPNKFKRFYDKFIYLVVILAPITYLPQLLKVWVEKDASGVSSLSWLFFSIISAAWLIYGVLHKDKSILIMNAALIVVQALIALGGLWYG